MMGVPLQFDVEVKPESKGWSRFLPRWHCLHASAGLVTLLLVIAGIVLWVYVPSQVTMHQPCK